MTIPLLVVDATIDPADERRAYIDVPVVLPAAVTALRLELAFEKIVDEFQLYGALFEPDGTFRGHVQCPGGPGRRNLQITIAGSGSSPGCIDGDIPAGTWTARIDLDRFVTVGSYRLTVLAITSTDELMTPSQDDSTNVGDATPRTTPTAALLPGWVRGELHSHSRHSDGASSVDRLVAAAREASLSFLAVSDHFTWSHWADVDRIATANAPRTPSLLHSIEVTTHGGHANVHGLGSWPGTYIDAADRGFTELAQDVHAQGGLIGVNHPFSGRQAWSRTDAPWEDVDLLEVVNAGQGANNDAAIGLWDRLLSAGHRIVAVAGTDSHDPDSDAGRLGELTTLIPAPTDGDLHEHAILAALVSGRTCVSRGAAIDIAAHSGGASVPMGGSLVLDGELHLRIEIDTPVDGVLFLFRDGLLWSLHSVSTGRHVVDTIDRSGVRGPYRAEFHRGDESEQFWASSNRSHDSLLALSNPVWID